MTQLRMAVVGVGALGQHHATKLTGFSDVDLVAVVDAREQQGQAVASKCDTQWCADTSQLPDDLDGVVIAVPTTAHLQVASQFIRRGIPVLIEKPLASSLEEAQQLHELSAASGGMIQVGHIERFNPAFQLVRRRVNHPLYVRCQRVSPYAFRSMDIGVVHDLMIHDIDLVLDLAGSSADSVEAFGAVTIGPQEDFAVARVRFRSGLIADLTAGRMCPAAERTMQIWDPSGVYSVDLHARTVSMRTPQEPFATRPSAVHDRIAAAENPLALKDEVYQRWLETEQLEGGEGDALEAELREFADCVATGTPPRVGSGEAVAAMEIAERVLAEISLYSYQNASIGQSTRRAA
jgi:predicted dehydrogenase